MTRVRGLAALALFATLVSTAAAAAPASTNWADTTGDGADDPSYAATKAICRKADAPLPPASGLAAKPGCSSEALYYGIGRPADPAAARACAMLERKDPKTADQPFAGDAMLTTIFANGRGAPRDLDVALALACRLDGAPAEMDGRVKHLAALKANGAGHDPFSVCDDATSGSLEGQCAYHDSEIAAAAREDKFKALASTLPPDQQASLAKVRAAADTFAEARAGNEIDLSGTARVVFETEARDAVKDDLLALLTAAPAKGIKPFAEEDKALNATWRSVMDVKDPQWGTPTKDGIRQTQRLWLAYRDALRSLMAERGDPDQGSAVAAALTHRRVADLKSFLE